jgi:hypothetical protein
MTVKRTKPNVLSILVSYITSSFTRFHRKQRLMKGKVLGR